MNNQNDNINSDDEFTEKNLEEMSRLSYVFAEAKSNRVALESQRKALRAVLMKEAEVNHGITSAAKQEREAEADFRYFQIIDALKTAQHNESLAYMQIEIQKIRFEKWRTERADFRASLTLR